MSVVWGGRGRERSDSTAMANFFHLFPHIGASDYNPSKSSYRTSLKFLIFLSVLISIVIIIVLMSLLTRKMNSLKGIVVPRPCHCLEQSQIRRVFAVLLIVSLMLMILEVIIHCAFWRLLPKVYLNPENHSMKLFREEFVKRADHIWELTYNEKLLLDMTQDPEHPISDLNETVQDHFVNIKSVCMKLNHSIMAPRALHTPRKQFYLKWAWIRFIICFLLFLTCFLMCLLRFYNIKRATIRCGMCGILFCGFALGYLIAFAVMMGDACQNPTLAFSRLELDANEQKIFNNMTEQLCKEYSYNLNTLVLKCRRSFLLAERCGLLQYFEMHASNESVNYKTTQDWVDRSYQSERATYFENLYLSVKKHYNAKINETEVKWTDRLNCDQDTLDDYDKTSLETARKLCKNNAALKWIALQILLILIMMALFIFLVQLLINSNREDITTVVTLMEAFKILSDKKCNHPDCLRNRNCKCVKELRKAIREGRLHSEDEEKKKSIKDKALEEEGTCIPIEGKLSKESIKSLKEAGWEKCKYMSDSYCSSKSKCSIERKKKRDRWLTPPPLPKCPPKKKASKESSRRASKRGSVKESEMEPN